MRVCVCMYEGSYVYLNSQFFVLILLMLVGIGKALGTD